MFGKYSANSEELEKFLERQLTTIELVNENSSQPLDLAPKDGPYHLDNETIEILNADRIDTGG